MSLSSFQMQCREICAPQDKLPNSKVILFTKAKSKFGQTIKIKNSSSISSTLFNPTYPTRFIAHDWQGGPRDAVNTLIKNAYLSKGLFNIFVVDWTYCSKNTNYFRARCCVKDVGKQIAQFIDMLHMDYKLKFNKTSLIGYGLGAHCMGNTGKYVKYGKIHSIIGLDPSKKCFFIGKNNDILSECDAEYVETIHTNGNKYGLYEPIGRAAFYPNGGKKQPGCKKQDINTCSHYRSYIYYAESIIFNNYKATKCRDYDDLVMTNCSTSTGLNDSIKMGGEPTNHGKADGIYFLITNNKKPFAYTEKVQKLEKAKPLKAVKKT